MQTLDQVAVGSVFTDHEGNAHEVDEAGFDTHAEAGPAGERPLFPLTAAEQVKERDRVHDRRAGLLIGPKNLEKLRAFGYDVIHVQDGPLTPGVAHRGMTE